METQGTTQTHMTVEHVEATLMSLFAQHDQRLHTHLLDTGGYRDYAEDFLKFWQYHKDD